IDGRIPTQPVGTALQVPDDVADAAEVQGFALCEALRELEEVVVLVDDEYAPGAHELGAFGRKQADRSRAEHHHRVTALDACHFRSLVAGRIGVLHRTASSSSMSSGIG